jgi:magnesium transporter
MAQALSHVDTTLTRSHSSYLGQVSIEITIASNRANDIMAKLTAIASIMVPLNVITGLWGMNVTVPGMAADGGGIEWFYGILVAMALIVLIGFFAVRWLDRKIKVS